MQLGTVDKGKVEVSGKAVSVFVAIVAIVPALVTACTESLVKPLAQKSTSMIETAKLDLERRKAAVELYRKALANPDASQRQQLVRFLIDTKLIDDEANVIAGRPPEQIPHWPPTP
jgi:hypothetical protein